MPSDEIEISTLEILPTTPLLTLINVTHSVFYSLKSLKISNECIYLDFRDKSSHDSKMYCFEWDNVHNRIPIVYTQWRRPIPAHSEIYKEVVKSAIRIIQNLERGPIPDNMESWIK